jgi:AraC-like DNA-binding protein
LVLSPAFRRQTGVSLTRYRNRIRVSKALHRLEKGDRDLGGLAADLGFADQAHLTRTMTEHTGYTLGASDLCWGQRGVPWRTPVQPCQQHGDPVDAGGHLLATTHASASPAATRYRPR